MCMTSKPILTTEFNGGDPLPYQEEHAACELPIRVASPINRQRDCCPSLKDDNHDASCCGADCGASGGPSPRKRRRTSNPLDDTDVDSDVPVSLQQPPQEQQTCSTPKERFSAFVSILLMQLSRQNYKLSIQAKALVAECVRRAEMGDPHFSPLEQNMAERLRHLVGEYHWNQAQAHLQYYLAKHHGLVLQTSSAASPAVAKDAAASHPFVDVGLGYALSEVRTPNKLTTDASSSTNYSTAATTTATTMGNANRLPLLTHLNFGSGPLPQLPNVQQQQQQKRLAQQPRPNVRRARNSPHRL